MEAFFLAVPSGRGFCLLHEPAPGGETRGAILYLHPFAEEMNKSRRMAGLQARALARTGWFVLQLDLHGCGDSDGDFADATWERWISDAHHAADWLRRRSGFSPALWGLRAGCLLAAAVALRLEWPTDLVFWQPVSSGKQHLQQFLRLRLAGALLGAQRDAAQPGGDGTRGLREQLDGGDAIEIAGYSLSPGLALGLDAARLAPPAGPARLFWLEVCAGETVELSPVARQDIQTWEAAGWRVSAAAIAGASFWQTVEIEELPGLIEATTELLGCAA
ncbi:hypothetical protein GALL_107400 [mine drainage metagenome]|uniref:Xaa-Pro dipeptidyl-peptidase-like domain-containing protein n=1 Tax=mine drainage metagenome TaxID=410659 RepID=A0A1J5SFG1_9ZZZZ